MESLLERGEKLDDLVSKSEVLGVQSKAFYKTVSALCFAGGFPCELWDGMRAARSSASQLWPWSSSTLPEELNLTAAGLATS